MGGGGQGLDAAQDDGRKKSVQGAACHLASIAPPLVFLLHMNAPGC